MIRTARKKGEKQRLSNGIALQKDREGRAEATKMLHQDCVVEQLTSNGSKHGTKPECFD
eukprot:CAMPEP_0203963038 /NCGR_PEP_ID=MMETSP0359-20131031/93090_1 /ASSEMBLY_ACC=CAM_ASM_000338 /TAXON_ID=268821 /ORGANISM="Scrippsiella Hangoei, Strain SHTV-5" /LENGTH=58 /DNA_ID=CAMNT_0050898671 /DNA_START=93 /DNA_END=266 /DNA_ORIENTATION=-